METITEVAKSSEPPRRKWLRQIGLMCLALLDVYAIAVLVPIIGWLLLGANSGWLAQMFTSTLPGVLLPAPFVLLIALIVRRRRLLALSAIPALLLLVGYGAQFLPRGGTVPAHTVELTVLTFNTKAVADNFDEMVAIIREADADIVLLQEYSEPAAAYFAAVFADDYPYQSAHVSGLSVVGKGILSRYPLEGEEIGPNPSIPQYQRVVIRPGDAAVSVYNVHLPPPHWGFNFNTTGRNQATTAVLARAADDTGALILGGDFNMSDQTDDYGRMAAVYGDSFREVGFGLGLSWPDFGTTGTLLALFPPIIRIDYVFHSASVQAVEAWVGHRSGGSDHRPLFVRLAIPRGGG